MLNLLATIAEINNQAEKNSQTYEDCGIHLMLTLRDCATKILNDRHRLAELVNTAAIATGATVLETHSYQFSPQGVTALAVLAESHASMHTYPESGTVFWDCFTCGTTCNPELSVEILVKALQPASINKQLISRQ